jgi:hypothetical protein
MAEDEGRGLKYIGDERMITPVFLKPRDYTAAELREIGVTWNMQQQIVAHGKENYGGTFEHEPPLPTHAPAASVTKVEVESDDD